MKIDVHDVSNYGYLGSQSPQGRQEAAGISYSIPLVLDDGTTVGVIGGDMLDNHVRKIMDVDSLAGSVDRALILAKRERGTRILEPVVTSGAVYDRYFGKKNALSYELAEQEQIGEMCIRDRLSRR